MIKRIRLKNFKSLADVDFCLEPVTVIIGRNSSGKTNFVNAVRALRDCVLRSHFAVEAFGGLRNIIPITSNKDVLVEFEIYFDIEGFPNDYIYKLGWLFLKGSGYQLQEESLSYGDAILLHQKEGKWVQPPNILPLPSPGTVAIGAASSIQEIAVAYFFLSNGIGCYEFSNGVLLNKNSETIISGFDDTGIFYLQALSHIVGDLRSMRNWNALVASLKCINPSVKNVSLKMPERSHVSISHDIGGMSVEFDLLKESEGFRRYLAHLIALYQVPPKQSLIFEEPEKGFHPGALAALAEQFRATPIEGRGQVILTTHSPQLLDYFLPQTIRVVEMENNITRIAPLVKEQFESLKENLMRSGELLTVDLARAAESASSI